MHCENFVCVCVCVRFIAASSPPLFLVVLHSTLECCISLLRICKPVWDIRPECIALEPSERKFPAFKTPPDNFLVARRDSFRDKGALLSRLYIILGHEF